LKSLQVEKRKNQREGTSRNAQYAEQKAGVFESGEREGAVNPLSRGWMPGKGKVRKTTIPKYFYEMISGKKAFTAANRSMEKRGEKGEGKKKETLNAKETVRKRRDGYERAVILASACGVKRENRKKEKYFWGI